MRKIRYGIVLLWMLLSVSVTSVSAEVSIGIGTPHVSIGINLPLFPELVPVPGYPVYYAPQVAGNYFFYDGLYWVYQDDYWYASRWYNGPWWVVEPGVVPLYILRIPVRYYRHPPPYFRGWRHDAPPRWGQHWGRDWEHQRRGWDRWNRGAVPPRAPLPFYQRKYAGDRYPRAEQQQMLYQQNYRYQHRDKAVRQQFQQREKYEAPPMMAPRPQDLQRQAPPMQPQQQQRGPLYQEQRPQPGPVPYERQAPRPQLKEQRTPDRVGPHEPRGGGPWQREDHGR
jgi:hypothetical protein